MDLVETIRGWQEDARAIDPINGVDKTIEDVGRLKGRAFFPEGLGLQRPNRASGDLDRPDILVVGHYFGTRVYRDRIEKKHGGSEENQPTWRNLNSLLGEALMDRCFMTNWFIGFGLKQIGQFLEVHTCDEGCSPSMAKCSIRRSIRGYEEQCRNLLIDQIRVLRPQTILLLGKEVIRQAHTIAPDEFKLRGWSNITSPFFQGVDAIGPVALNVDVVAASAQTNFVALIHPCQPQNHVWRGHPKKGEEWKKRQADGLKAEKAMIRQALRSP